MSPKTTEYNPINKEEYEIELESYLPQNHIINQLVCGYLFNIASDRDSVPKDIEQSCIDYFGILGKDGDLIIPNDTVHKLDRFGTYQFSSITIKKGATLTTESKKQILDIICFGDIILEGHAKISVDGMGYEGGIGEHAGQSYKTTYCCHTCPNYGGGASPLPHVYVECAD